MASGDTLAIFRPQDNEPPSGDFARLSHRNFHPVLLFKDAATDENAIFSGILPRNYGGGGITVYLHWSHGATVGNVDWDVELERIGDQQQDIGSDSFAAAQSADTQTVPGTSGLVDISAVTFTDGAQMDSLAVGEGFRMRVSRDGANDTASGDAQLRFIEIKET